VDASETPAETPAEVTKTASTVIAPVIAKWIWWLVGAGIAILIAVATALGSLWWLHRRKT
jgi:heme/copper-type cytochrome/quinol oxidase subunit 4